MGTRVNYPAEIKWKAIELLKSGKSQHQVAIELGIKSRSQVYAWWKWYRNGETHRFEQPVGKQYSYNKGIQEMDEVDRLKLRVKQLEMHNELLGKLNGILRK